MFFSRRKPTLEIAESVGDLAIATRRGIDPSVATRIARVTRGFHSHATLEDARGRFADARSIFSLLMLGARRGDTLRLRCIGRDAAVTYGAIAEALAGEEHVS